MKPFREGDDVNSAERKDDSDDEEERDFDDDGHEEECGYDGDEKRGCDDDDEKRDFDDNGDEEKRGCDDEEKRGFENNDDEEKLGCDDYEAELKDGHWLSCDVINRAQSLLRKQFSQQNGLQSTNVLKEGNRWNSVPEQFVQIIHDNNHWVCTSNCNC